MSPIRILIHGFVTNFSYKGCEKIFKIFMRFPKVLPFIINICTIKSHFPPFFRTVSSTNSTYFPFYEVFLPLPSFQSDITVSILTFRNSANSSGDTFIMSRIDWDSPEWYKESNKGLDESQSSLNLIVCVSS